MLALLLRNGHAKAQKLHKVNNFQKYRSFNHHIQRSYLITAITSSSAIQQNCETSFYKIPQLWYFLFMRELGADELFLRGRVQVETALGALAYTGMNPEAQQRLQTLLDAHAGLSDGQAQNDLSLYLQGRTAEREKTDIIMSLDALKDSTSATPDAKIAAEALRQIL
jgi:hypothetical protein